MFEVIRLICCPNVDSIGDFRYPCAHKMVNIERNCAICHSFVAIEKLCSLVKSCKGYFYARILNLHMTVRTTHCQTLFRKRFFDLGKKPVASRKSTNKEDRLEER